MDQITTRLSEYNNRWYHPGKSFPIRLIWFVANVIFFINPLNGSSGIKVFLLRLFGAQIGRGVVVKPGVNIKYPWNISIGDFSWIGERVWIDSLGKVSIGSNCCLSQGAVLLSGNHNYSKSTFDLMVNPIILEDGVWIGALSMVTGGVVCGSHSVLSVMSVASTNLEPYGIYKGNPAVLIKNRRISD